MHLTIFETILILLLISIATSYIFRRFKIPVIVGYIAVGMLVGPHALGLVSETEDVGKLAEFGLVFLMFSIGLEFSLLKLLKMKKAVFAYGGLEVLLVTVITTGIGVALSMTIIQAMIIGSIVAMSSTAIVIKQLSDQLEVNLKHGMNSVGILLFQDLAVIPVLILIPSLVDIKVSLAYEILEAIAKAIFAMGLIYFLGRKVLRPVFYAIAKMHTLEIFTLTAFFVTLGSSWLTHQLGLSMTLGAFLAGMMLGETEFRHQIETDIRPIRDVLIGLFFVSIGMEFRKDIVVQAWDWMLLLFLGLVIFKTMFIWGIGRVLRLENLTALRTGIILAHGGEFGFAILSLSMLYGLLPPDYAQVTLGALLLSMIAAPLLIRFNGSLALRIIPLKNVKLEEKTEEQIESISQTLSDHVILCGYGRVGQNIARFLDKANIPYMAFDLDPIRVKKAQLAGENVCYADATELDILRLANAHRAKALVITFYNTRSALKILEQLRLHDKKLPVIVRAHDDQEASELYDKGATEVIPEILEASLMLASHILLFMNVNPKQVDLLIHESRRDRYDLLRMVFPGQASLTLDELETESERLNVLDLGEKAKAIGKTIESLNLESIDVKITAIRRRNKRMIEPNPLTVLQANDTVILYGTYPNMEKAEWILIGG